MVCENRVLKRIFLSKRDEVPREWKKLHNKEFDYLYSSPDITRAIKSRTRWARHVAGLEDRTDACRILAGRPEGKKPLLRPRR